MAERILTDRGGVAVIGHVDRHAGAGGKFAPDVGADPVVAEIGAAPDHPVAAGRRHVQADAGDGAAFDPGSGGELVKELVELAEGGFVAILHQTPDLRDRAELFAEVIDQHGFHRGATDVETGVVGRVVCHVWKMFSRRQSVKKLALPW